MVVMGEAAVIRLLKPKGFSLEDLWLLMVKDVVVATAKTFDDIEKIAKESGHLITQYRSMPISAFSSKLPFKCELPQLKS
ncbi:MAG: hypothetical protein DRJ68_04855 [Thermoprotei archaeon]|mgnify:CR=1 FL=1|nr:MAG: hypothetical protein DRJ62_02570 [Thermoprotei archaeon]RLF20576.1 MAG: hypothetical protein DRJ68_04855 [Thermoprotei archaeon]